MPVRSKWQSLPTEQINPATSTSTSSPPRHRRRDAERDRQDGRRGQREKERIAVGVEIITQALRKNGRIVLRRRGTSGRLGVLESAEMPPTFGTDPDLVRRSWPAARSRAARARGRRGQLRGRRALDQPLRPTKKGRGHRRVGSGMTQFVRGALTRARRAGSKIIFVTCDPRPSCRPSSI
jgi:N-acetylmuramic acid 6-phosphate etherase